MQGLFAGGAVLIPLWFVQGLTDDRFTPSFSQAYFWIALGILIGCGGVYRRRPQPHAPHDPYHPHDRGDPPAPWVHQPFARELSAGEKR
jgi:hypothetical protein